MKSGHSRVTDSLSAIKVVTEFGSIKKLSHVKSWTARLYVYELFGTRTKVLRRSYKVVQLQSSNSFPASQSLLGRVLNHCSPQTVLLRHELQGTYSAIECGTILRLLSISSI
jgi:hypothetical protein